MSEIEVWVQAKGFPRYKVSNKGRVFDNRKDDFVRQTWVKGRVRVSLYDHFGESHVVEIHRLMAFSFFDVWDETLEVNHKDGDRTNNVLWNLEIVTHEENQEHGLKMGIIREPIKVLNLDTGEVYESLNQAGRKLGMVSPLNVPKRVREVGGEFQSGGYRLKLVE